MADVFVGLGSNLGAREEALRTAVRQLAASAALRPQGLRVSSVYETTPVPNQPPQPLYLNAVAAFATDATPAAVLDELLRIEHAMGRVRTERWGARLIDLDLLLHGDSVVKTRALEVPHPRLAERAFALAPLAELAPDARHPVVGKTAAELYALRPAEERAGVRPVGPLEL